jgi:valyl-tRNA synthetase
MTETAAMDKRFDPASYEARWQQAWAASAIFVAESPSSRPSYCIMIPPPNVTGRLHMGHALQSALQDILTRWRRMQGYNALWLPGTDHAGIATQLMVERQVAKEGTSRREMGREAFIARVWEWKHEHSDHIRHQLELLGSSCDFTRERFTLDEGLSKAVTHAFVTLYRQGLITRGAYMVNWSPKLETAVSDLEVETKTVKSKLYHVAYDVEGSGERIVVATTRPETILGDTAVAMNPDDERYAHLHGAAAILPFATERAADGTLQGRRLPFVTDTMVEKEFGTGLVKITPYHDPNDFELAKRHDLPGILVIDRQGRMTEAAGPEFAGLDREEARAKVVERLREQGRLVKVEDYTHNVGHSQRSGEPIEPMLSTQWFCDVRGMADQALAANRDGRLKLVPESWDKTWEHWLANIKPWCISRQLWWGHQIPAWYDAEGRIFVAASREEAEALAGTDQLTQDPDVLDTWFSSALWPFSTLGWPEKTSDLATFYPTSVLITGFDILFFWVARMVMAGLHFTGQSPFHTVHLTGLVRDREGQKMSKTKGNVVFPDELVATYGADAVRFTLAILDSPGRDIPLDPERIAGYRAFGNKIWNAVRFALSRIGDAQVQTEIAVDGLAAPERWILSRLARTAAEVDAKLETFRFDEAANALYHFIWHELCDWSIELAKPALSGEAPRPRVGEVLVTVLDQSLRLLHPFMPFLSEEVWQRLPGHQAIHAETICLAPYPRPVAAWDDPAAEAGIESLMAVVNRIRNLRVELGLSPKAKLHAHLDAAEPGLRALLGEQLPLVAFLCRLDSIALGAPTAATSRDRVAADLVAGVQVALVAEEAGLGDEERRRLEGELTKLETELERLRGRLANEQFTSKAPPSVVDAERRREREMEERRARMRAGLGLA